jgi:CheY-like chemotaxis protein
MTPLLPCVLAAEDEASDAYILQLAFEEAKVANPLIIVGDGEEAVNYLSGIGCYADRAAHPLPGLITLDLKMPRMNGFDVLTWLRARPEFNHIPAVVISSSSEDADIQAARRLGARDYFVKPHRLGEFINIVQALREKWLLPASP